MILFLFWSPWQVSVMFLITPWSQHTAEEALLSIFVLVLLIRLITTLYRAEETALMIFPLVSLTTVYAQLSISDSDNTLFTTHSWGGSPELSTNHRPALRSPPANHSTGSHRILSTRIPHLLEPLKCLAFCFCSERNSSWSMNLCVQVPWINIWTVAFLTYLYPIINLHHYKFMLRLIIYWHFQLSWCTR